MTTVHLAEWSFVGPHEAGPSGQALAGRRFSTDAARVFAKNLGSRLVVRELFAGLEIESTSHVGRVSLGDLTVQIQPKFAPDVLLKLFRYAYGLNNLNLYGEAEHVAGGSLFEELLIVQLVAEIEHLIQRGLFRAYLKRSESLSVPRGRINVARLARGWAVERTRIPCDYHVRTPDNALNRTLRSGLVLARDIASDGNLLRRIDAAAQGLQLEQAEPLTAESLARAFRLVNRMTAAYEPALRLAKLLYETQYLRSDDGGQSVRLRGFLFDMNQFFQALLGRLLKENLPAYEVATEHVLHDFISYAPNLNPHNRQPLQPRPDSVLRSNGKITAILDAKYRDLWSKELPPAMLYQLLVYASAHECREAAIIYPADAANARAARIDMRGGAGTGVSVWLRPLPLEKVADAVARQDKVALAQVAQGLLS